MNNFKEAFGPLKFAAGAIFGKEGIGRAFIEYKLLQILKQRIGSKGDNSGILHAVKSSLERRVNS